MLGSFRNKKQEIPEKTHEQKLQATLESQLISKENLANLLKEVEKIKFISQENEQLKLELSTTENLIKERYSKEISEKNHSISQLQNFISSQKQTIEDEVKANLRENYEKLEKKQNQLDKTQEYLKELNAAFIKKSNVKNYLDIALLPVDEKMGNVISKANREINHYIDNDDERIIDDLWYVINAVNKKNPSNYDRKYKQKEAIVNFLLSYISYIFSNELKFNRTSLNFFVAVCRDESELDPRHKYMTKDFTEIFNKLERNRISLYEEFYAPMKILVDDRDRDIKLKELQIQKLEIDIKEWKRVEENNKEKESV